MMVTKLPPPRPGGTIPPIPVSLIQAEYLQLPMKNVTSSICLSVLIQVLFQNMSWSIFRSLAPSKSKGNRKYFVTLPRSVVGNTVPDFAGVTILPDAAPGGPVLADALAFLGCCVRQRLEAGDHWIIYAEVESGRVADQEGHTAVHHRKVGNHY